MKFISAQNPWSEQIIIFSLFSTCAILIFDYEYKILPFSGNILLFYICTLLIGSISFTFVVLQNLLQHNKPLKYSFKEQWFTWLFKSALSFSKAFSCNVAKECGQQILIDNKTNDGKQTKSVDQRIDEFVKDVIRRFLLNWYAYISSDPEFPSEARDLLHDVVRKFLHATEDVDSKKLLNGVLLVFLRHVKEFRKAAIRIEKHGGSIEDCYR